MKPKKDPFSQVYALTKLGKNQAALNLLINQRSGKICEAVASDPHQAWYCAGDIFFRQCEFLEAKKAFKKALHYRPDDEDTLEAIGNCYDALGRPKLAERFFRRALSSGSNSLSRAERAAISFNLANALFDQRRWDEALDLYDELKTGYGPVSKKAARNYILAAARLGSVRNRS